MNLPNAQILATSNQRTTDRVPMAALLVMALMGFVLIASETMPAGLLPQLASGMHTSEASAGQFVSAYALGTVLAAIPLTAATRGARRKPVALLGLFGLLLANVVTAVSPNVVLSLGFRAFAGVCSGLLWGMLAGYARRISPPEHAGRALAVASLGVPAGLALGTPLGSWLGSTLGWRYAFAALAMLSLGTIILTLLVVPDAPGQPAASHLSVKRVFAIPGVTYILSVILVWMVAHNTLYTYISSYLQFAHIGLSTQAALVLFGVAAIGGVWITGALIDRALRSLVLISIAAFVAAGAVMVVASGSLVAVVFAVVLWGVAFGGAATQLQTAMADATGENADVANSLLGVAFNVAIFAGGVSGAALITHFGGASLPVVMTALAAIAFMVALAARRAGLPPRRQRAETDRLDAVADCRG